MSEETLKNVQKGKAMEDLSSKQTSAISKYKAFFLGTTSWRSLLRYEFCAMFASGTPGAVGYVLRKRFYRKLLGHCGSGVMWGQGVGLRHPGKMSVGDGVAVDDHALLDARFVKTGEFVIGDRVLIARDVLIQAKADAGTVAIGEGCSIGAQSTITSCGGVEIGDSVLIAGQCYIGGGRYHHDRLDQSIMEQGLYTQGCVRIGDGAWLGAGVRVIDGVRIGAGAIVGAGAVVTADIPDYGIAVGVPAKVIGSREDKPAQGSSTLEMK